MEWIERLNSAINYLEEHIREEVDYGQMAKIACCSTYHFQRMFAYMANVPLSEYIRRRRMSLAAADLRNGEKVVDVALKYGYTSPTSFNRAFQGVHGIAPSLAREEGIVLKAYPPISFKIIIQGADEMDYRIEKMEAFRIIGISEPLDEDLEKNFEAVPKLWGRASEEGLIPRLFTKMNRQPMGLLGVTACFEENNWKYFIAVASDMGVENGLEEYTVPSFTWAKFSGSGPCPESIQALEKRIVSEWLPTSGYEYDNGPDVEVYLTPDVRNAQFEVWVPVKKAQG